MIISLNVSFSKPFCYYVKANLDFLIPSACYSSREVIFLSFVSPFVTYSEPDTLWHKCWGYLFFKSIYMLILKEKGLLVMINLIKKKFLNKANSYSI